MQFVAAAVDSIHPFATEADATKGPRCHCLGPHHMHAGLGAEVFDDGFVDDEFGVEWAH